MKVLALDLSTKTGWAFFEDAQLVSFGLIEKKRDFNSYGNYPYNFIQVAQDVVDQISSKIVKLAPDEIVIEETNKTGRFGSRHSQKILEFIHCLLVKRWGLAYSLKYVNTSDWRKKLKLSVADTRKAAKPLLKEFKRLKGELANASKADKKKAKAALDLHKKTLKDKCIHGKIDKKSISVAFVNLNFNLTLKKGDNDISDAICLGEAYRRGVHTLTNKDIFEHEDKAILQPSGGSI